MSPEQTIIEVLMDVGGMPRGHPTSDLAKAILAKLAEGAEPEAKTTEWQWNFVQFVCASTGATHEQAFAVLWHVVNLRKCSYNAGHAHAKADAQAQIDAAIAQEQS